MKRKVAIYARVSTEHEAQLSALDNQVQDYDNLLKQHPDWELYDRYIDEGITGTSVKKRKNFLRMMEDAEKGCFDLIITREVSRFARNTVDTLQETRKLKRLGVEVYFKEDNIWTFNDEDGELKLTIMATLAQNESRKTSQRVKAGMKISMQNGVFYGTGNILGYDRIGKEMVVNKEQAQTVKLIYKLFLDGYGTQRIKYELEKRGIPTATGLKKWSFSNISRVLQNPFYCGTIVYRKQFIADYLEQKKFKNKGQVDQVVVEGKHEPIISKEEFDAVQKLIKQHSIHIENSTKKTVTNVPRNIWSKKLKCECGSSVNRRVFSRANPEKPLYSYYCYKQKNEGSKKKREQLGLDTENYCNTPNIQEWKLELMASILFNNILNDKEKILNIACETIDEAITTAGQNEELLEEINYLKDKINNNKAKSKKLLDGYTDGIISGEDYYEKKSELEKENKNMQDTINEIEKKSSSINISDIKTKILQLKNKINTKLDYDNQLTDELIDLYVDEIIIHNDRLDWKLNYISSLKKDIEDSSMEKQKDIFLTRILISREDIVKFNNKKHYLSKICQKDPIIMDIYI